MADRPRILVTGLGAVSALGVGVEALCAGLAAGRSGIGPITLYDASLHPVRIAGEAKGYDASAHFPRKDLRRLGRFSQFAVVAAREAVAAAGLSFDATDPGRVATVIGSGIGDFETVEEQLEVLRVRGPEKMNPFTVPRVITNMAAANVAMEWGLTGPGLGTISACATGAHAVGIAALLLRQGLADVALAGAAEACLSKGSVLPYHALRALSTRDVPPERASCPFDRERDGFVIAEGAGVLVLETEAHARARSAPVLAELAGFGMSCDAHHVTASPSDGRVAARAMTAALSDAGLAPDGIDHVNAHGTATPLNDPVETRAIRLAFGSHADRLAVSSIKSMVGHPLAAAGAVEAVAAVRALTDRVVPPTINLHHPDPECDLDYVPNSAREMTLRAVMSNSFGFGGQNGVLVFRAG